MHGIREYSQWFCGTNNTVAYALSGDDNQSDKELTKILSSHCLSQLPRHFKTVPLPSKVTSWLTSLLLQLPIKPQLVETHTRTTLGCGTATSNTATGPDSETLFFSTECPNRSGSKSRELSLWLCIKGNFCNSVMLPWLKAQLQIPSVAEIRKQMQRSQKGHQKLHKPTSTMATKALQKGGPQRDTAESLSCLHPPPHPLF